jgi:hypothetical protein
MTKWIVSVLVVITTASPTQGGIVVSLAPSAPTVSADPDARGSVLLSVRAAADEGTQTLKAYDLLVDLSPPGGVGLPSGWTVEAPVDIVELGGFFDPGPSASADVYAGDIDILGSGIVLDTSPITLWEFTVNMNGFEGARDGVFEVKFLGPENPAFSLIDANEETIDPIMSNPASITLDGFNAVVPEPSSIGFTGLAALAVCLTRRRRSAFDRR